MLRPLGEQTVCGFRFSFFVFFSPSSDVYLCITTHLSLRLPSPPFPPTTPPPPFLYFQHERKGSQGSRRQGPVRKGRQGERESRKEKCNLSSVSCFFFLSLFDASSLSSPSAHGLLPLLSRPRVLLNPLENTQGTLGAGKGATGDKKKPVSRSARAGLTFPVGRVHRQLKLRATANGRVGATAAVYSAAILGELVVLLVGRGVGAECHAREAA